MKPEPKVHYTRPFCKVPCSVEVVGLAVVEQEFVLHCGFDGDGEIFLCMRKLLLLDTVV